MRTGLECAHFMRRPIEARELPAMLRFDVGKDYREPLIMKRRRKSRNYSVPAREGKYEGRNNTKRTTKPERGRSRAA